MNNNYDSQEIDLIHLFLTVLTKWKVIIFAIIIGAALGGGYAALKVDGAKDIKGNISSATLINMQTAKEYYNGYMKEKEWFNESPIARLGYEKGCQASAQYLIKGDDSLSIASVYSMIIRNDDFGSFLKENCKADVNLEYLNEIINVSINNYAQASNNNNVVVSVASEDKNEDQNIKDDKPKKENDNERLNNSDSKISALVTYVVRCQDNDKAQAIVEALNEYVEKYYSENANNKHYIIEKLGTFYEPYVPALQDPNYQIHLNKRNELGQEYEKLLNTFSDDEKRYFSEEYLGGNSIKLEGDMEDNDSEYNRHLKVCLKWIIVGAFICCVIAGGIICCTYLFNGRIKSVSELNMFNVPLYGIKREKSDKHNTKLDKYIEELLDASSGLTLSDEYASESVVLQGYDSLFIYNDSHLSEGEGICDGKLWEDIPNVYISDKSCSNDRDSLIKAKELGNEIIIVEINKSKLKDLIAEIETAQIQKINVAGIIGV